MKYFLFGVLFVAFSVLARPGEEMEVPQPEGKVAEYYEMLLKRPRPGYLFERFYNSWMEQYDLSDLETFLKSNASDEAVLLLAFYHDMNREPVESAELYAKLLADHPDRVEVLYYKALADVERGLYIEATDGLEKLLALEPPEKMELDALTLLGRTLLRAGRRDEGVAAWTRLLEASGTDPDIVEELIELQLTAGLYKEALELCDRLLEASDDNFRKIMLRMRRVAVLVRMDRRSDAVDGLREAFGLAGQGSWLQRDVLARIEQLFRGADDMAGLCALYESMLEERSSDPALLRAYAGALSESGKDEKALETGRELVRLMPDRREVKEWYADMLLDHGRNGEATRLLEDFLERYPDDNALRMRLAAIHHGAGEDEEAVEWVRSFVEHSEKEVSDYLQAARVLARYGLENEATAIYLDLLNIYPESVEGREAIARHLGAMGHPSLAWKHYEMLGKTCDLDTLLRLVSSLQATRDASGAYALLDSRKDDFGGDFRFATVFFDVAGSLDKTEESLRYGLKRIDLAQTLKERELAVSMLVYWMKQQKLVEEWIGRLSEEADLDVGRTWLLASLHLEQKNRKEAKRVLEQAMERNPADEEVLLECRLLLAERERDWATGESVLLELLERNPKMRTARIRDLVQVLRQAGKYDTALEWIEAWKKVSPHAIRPYETETEVLVAANRREEAIKSMRRAVSRFDESAELRASLGRLYEQSGRWQEAEQLYWGMLNAEETLDARLGHLANIIRVSQRHNKMDALIEELERRAENSKKAAFPLLGLAECYRLMHRSTERALVLDRVLELRPSDVAVLREKARMEEELGNYDAARTLMMHVADSDTSGRAFRKLVEFELLYGNAARAKEMMLDPRIADDADGYIELVEALFKRGGFEVLLDPLRKRAEMETEDYRFAYLYALALEESGRTADAAMAFVPLLKVETERSGVKPPKAGAVPRSPNVYGPYTDLLPDDLLRLYQAMTGNHKYQAYAYRRQNSYRGYSMGAGSTWYPSRLELLEPYVLAHLQGIISARPEGEREALLSKTGIEEELPYARLLLIEPDKPIHQAAWWTVALAQYPDSAELRMMQTLMMPQTLQTEVEFRAAITDVSAEFPLVALRVLSQGLRRFPAMADLLSELVDRSVISTPDEVGTLTQILLQMVRTVPAAQPIPPGVFDLLAETEKRVAELEGVSEGAKLQLGLVRAIVEGDAAAIMEMQKKTFYKQLAVSNVPMIYRGAPMHYYGGRSYFPYGNRSIPFPPNRLPNVQIRVVQTIGQTVASGVFGKVGAEELKVAAEADDDALFRLLVLAQLGATDETLEAAVETLEKKESPTVDEQLTLISWYNERNPERSLELLLEIRKTGKDRNLQMLAGQWLLMAVPQVDAIPEELKSSLKAEIKKMTPSISMDRSQRMLLIGVMEMLEMPVDTLLVQQAGSSSRSRGRRVSTTRRLDPYGQVRELFKKGEKEDAVQRVAGMLRKESLQKVYFQKTNNRNNYHLDNCLNLIKQEKMEDKLLEVFRPGDDASPRRIFEYAFACERLGKNAEAMAGYRSLRELRPGWNGAEARLFGLMAMEDPETAQELLSKCSASMVNGILSGARQRMGDTSVSYEKRLAYGDLLLSQLERVLSMDMNIAQNYSYQLESAFTRNNWYESNREQLPKLYDPLEAGILAPDWKAPEKLSDNLKYLKNESLRGIQQRRRELYLKFLRIQMEIPRWSRQGFSRYLAYTGHVGMEQDHDELMRRAEKILRGGGGGFSSYSSNSRTRKVLPLEFYLVGLHKAGHSDKAEKLLAEMETSNPDYNNLKSILDILAAETDTDYLARVEKALKTSIHNRTLAGLVLRLPELGGRPVDLDEALWRQLREWGKNNQAYMGTELLKSWIALKKESRSPSELVQFIERYLDEVFTEAEKRIIAKAGEGGLKQQSHQMLFQKYSGVQQALSNADLPPEVLPALLKTFSYYDRRFQHYNVAGRLLQTLQTHASDSGVDYGWMEKVGFLGEWDTFELYSLSGRSTSLFAEIINQLRGNQKKKILEQINAMDRQTFGSGLVKTLLETDRKSERPTRVLAYLAGYADTMAGDPQGQDELFEFLHWLEKRYGGALEEPSDESLAYREMHDRYSAWVNRVGMEQLESLENLKIGTAVQDWHRWRSKWRDTVQLVLESDPDRAFQLFRHMLRLDKQYALFRGQSYDEKSSLRRLFQSPKGFQYELAFGQRAVDESGSESAREWYREYVAQWANYRLDRTEKKRRKQGDNHRAARLFAGKECLLELLATDSGSSLTAVQNCINRIDRKAYPELAEWLAEQELPDTDLKRLLGIYLHSTPTDGEWLGTFFADERYSAKERLDAYGWLARLGKKKPKVLDSPELLLTLVALVSENGQTKLPASTYQTLVRYATEMEPDEEREELVQNVLRLWHADRVNISQTDQTTLFRLIDLAASAGKTKEAVAFLSTGELPIYPRTYAVALRHGFDEFIRKYLLSNILRMKSSYSSSTVWLSPEAVESGRAIAEDVEDEEMRLTVELFLARLPVKAEGKARVDYDRIRQLLTQATKTMNDPKKMRWVVEQFNEGKTKKAMLDFNLHYLRNADIIGLLERKSSRERWALEDYMSWVKREGDLKEIEKLLEVVDAMGKQSLNVWGSSLLRIAINSGEQALVDKAFAIALKAEKKRNPEVEPDRISVCQWLGLFMFDPADLGFENLGPTERMAAFEAFDEEMMGGLSSRRNADPRLKDRGIFEDEIEVIDEMVEMGGRNGFVPMIRSIHHRLIAVKRSRKSGRKVDEYVGSLESGPLMVDQIKAAFDVFRRGDKENPEALMVDAEKYLSRADLDPIEKLRFVVFVQKKRGRIFVPGRHIRKEIMGVLGQNDGLVEKYALEIMMLFPQPDNESEFPLYNRFCDHILESLSQEAAGKKKKTKRRIEWDDLVRVLFALDRGADATRILDEHFKTGSNPELFMAAFESGETEWCAKQLALWNELSVEERMKAYGTFDHRMARVATEQILKHRTNLQVSGLRQADAHAAACVEWLGRWLEAEAIGFVPLHRTFSGIFASLPDEVNSWKTVEQYIRSLESGGLLADQIKASFAMEKLTRFPADDANQLLADISRYLSRDDLDDCAKIDFVAGNSGQVPNRIPKFPGRKEVFGALQRNSGLEATYGPAVLWCYPLPAGKAEFPLYNRVADQIMENPRTLASLFEGKTYDAKLVVHVRTLFALGRTQDALKILDDEASSMSRKVEPFAVALENNEPEWCVRNLSELLCWRMPTSSGDLRHLNGARKGLPLLLDKIHDDDQKLTAEIFFEAVCSNGEESHELEALAKRFEKHNFSNTVYAVLSRDILEEAGVVDTLAVDPEAQAWFAVHDIDDLIKNPEEMYPAKWRVFKNHLNGLMDKGEMGRATEIYEELEKIPFWPIDVLWISEAAMGVDSNLCAELVQGKRVELPGRFIGIDMQQRFQLQQAVDAFCKKGKANQSSINSHLNFVTAALSGHGEQDASMYNVQVDSLEILFPCFTLFSGVQEGEPDEAKMKSTIEEFAKVITYHDQVCRWVNWGDAATVILKTYPYSLEPEKWEPLVLGLAPRLLEPVQPPAGTGKIPESL